MQILNNTNYPDYVKINYENGKIKVSKKVGGNMIQKKLSLKGVEKGIKSLQDKFDNKEIDYNGYYQEINDIIKDINDKLEQKIEEIELAIEEKNKPENKYINSKGLINGIAINKEEGGLYLRLSLKKNGEHKNTKSSLQNKNIKQALSELVEVFCEFHQITSDSVKLLLLGTTYKYQEIYDEI